MTGPGKMLARLLGEFDWQPPPWWRGVAGGIARGVAWARVHRVRAAVLGVALLATGAALSAAAWWWQHRPQPDYVGVELDVPPPRDLSQADSRPGALLLRFSRGVAPLAAIGKPLDAGPRLEPAVEGAWSWDDETTLRFEPVADWPVGQRYVLRLDPATLLREGAALRQRSLEFTSSPFAASVERAEFYQDPTDVAIKRVVVTLRFTHPVDPRSLAPRVAMRLGGEAREVEIGYDELRLSAFLRSSVLTMPDRSTPMRITIDDGVRSSLGGPGTAKPLAAAVEVPGRFSLAVRELELGFVTNEKLESEQILTVAVSAGVAPEELRPRLRAWLLPQRHPDARPDEAERPFAWNTPALVADEILARAEPLALEAVEPASDYPELQSFRYRAPEDRWVYVRVESGVKSFGGFELGRRHDATLRVPRLPREVRILHSGSLLALRGERRVSLYSREVPAIRYEIGRVLPDRLHLLATQTSGRFGNPDFNAWSLSFDDLAEIEERVEPVAAAAARGAVQYHGFDLGPFLERAGSPRTGVFVVRAQGWDPATRSEIGARDERLILVTDLGFLVKRAVDGREDVFVQSLASGEPVAGAIVQVIGRNGVAVVTRSTDERGHATLPSLRDYRREREPVLYVVRAGDDASFLPVSRYDRRLDLSRFDVGGVSNATESGALSAYLFSDRGIYRPGDELRIGIIVKAANWSQSLTGVPLEAIVSDARGAVVRRERLRLSAGGFEELRHATGESATTGTWNVSLHLVRDGRADARLGGVTVNVQEFLPDRLRLALRLSQERETGWVSPERLEAEATLRTLFDTPAAGRRIESTLRLTPRVPAFEAWKDFRFVDPQKAKRTIEERLADVTTDADGRARLALDLGRFEAGVYSLQIVAQGFEAGGGRGVTQVRGALVSSLPYLIGVRTDGDLGYVGQGAAREAEIVAIDPSLAAVAVDGLSLALLERRQVSVLERQDDGTLRYESRLKEIPIESRPLALGRGAQRLALRTATPGDWALVVRDPRGRELNRIEYSVVGTANVARRMDRNAELDLRLARTDVAPGEEIELSVRAPYAGAGLITIERERVHAFRWFRADTTASIQRIRLPEGFEGNGYVSVTFLRDPNSDEIFTSPLSHGVAPFSVALDRRRLDVSVEAPAQVRPGEPLEIRYRSARPARVVVFGVDEGILQVAGWRNPDPLRHFFEKRALEVDTQQILDLLLPEFRQLVTAAPGGDEDATGTRYLNPFRRRRDSPVAFWSGVVDAGPAPQTYRYAVPDSFNGTLRLVAVAVAADAVGVASSASVARGDFVFLPNAPTHVAPGDEFEFSASITNNTAQGAAADVATTLVVSSGLEILGARADRQRIEAGREGLVRFRVRARAALGSATLTLESRSGERRARSSTTLSIRPAAVESAQLAVGAFRGREDVAVSRRLRPERRRLEATLSNHPLAIAGGFEAFLAEYPYGCTEQLVSQALPAVVLSGRPELGATNLDAARERYRRLLLQLRARQTAEGGFGYWPGDSAVTPYPSIWALQLLVEARDRGIEAPRDVLDRGADWLASHAAGEGGTLGDERTRAYAIYLLTRLGRVASNHANALLERLDRRFGRAWRQDLAAAYLGAAYQNMRQSRLAGELVSGVTFSSEGERWKIDHADAAGGFFYSELAHNAQLLYLLARHFPQRLQAADAAPLLAIAAAARREHNTLTAAWTLLALDAQAAVIEARPAAALAIGERLRGGALRSLTLAPGLVRRATFSAEAEALRFTAGGDSPAFYTVLQSGFDAGRPDLELKQGIEVQRDYLDAAGSPVTALKQGEEVTVRLRVRSMSSRVHWDGVLVDLLPGGFEPVLEAAEGLPADGAGRVAPASWRPDYVDRREDRVLVFGAIGPQVQTFSYRARATASGRFEVPPAHAESMYDPLVRARTLGGVVVVGER